MIKKMCPICDLPVTAGNYCPRCRKVIRNPYKQEINYYLNERHPEDDAECDYHHPYLEADHHGEKAGGYQPGSPVLQPENRRPDFTGRSPEKGVRKDKKSSARKPLVMIAAWVVVMAGVGINAVGMRNSDTNRMEESSSEESYEIVSLSPEEVKAAGKPCNGLSHFPVDGSSIRNALRTYIIGNGSYLLVSEDTVWDNYCVPYDDYEDSTYYGTDVTLYLAKTSHEEGDTEEEAQYVSIDYDTGDGTLHEYMSALSDPQGSVNFLREFLIRTEELCGFSEEECHAASIMEQAEEIILEGQSGYLAEGIFDIRIYTDGEQIRIYAWYNDTEELNDSQL